MKTTWTSRGTAIRVRPFLKIVNGVCISEPGGMAPRWGRPGHLARGAAGDGRGGLSRLRCPGAGRHLEAGGPAGSRAAIGRAASLGLVPAPCVAALHEDR